MSLEILRMLLPKTDFVNQRPLIDFYPILQKMDKCPKVAKPAADHLTDFLVPGLHPGINHLVKSLLSDLSFS